MENDKTLIDRRKAKHRAASRTADQIKQVWGQLIVAFTKGPDNLTEVNRLKEEYDRLEEILTR